MREKAAGEKRPLSLQTLITQGTVILNPAIENTAGLPVPPEAIAPLNASSLVEIPTNFRTIKQQDFALAETWRLHTRHLFETAFAQGFTVTDFVFRVDENGRSHSYYLLTIDN